MKKYIIALFLIITAIESHALSTLNIQGQVTNIANGNGIANDSIYITDSANYNDIITTGVNGYYIILITNTTYNKPYYLRVKDCNNIWHHGVAYANDNINTINFSICYTTSMNCQNGFSYTKQNNITFNFTGSNASSNPTVYYWNFGDGNTAVGQNVSHVYPQPTTTAINYQVTLNTKTVYPADTCYYQSIQMVMVTDTNPKISGKVTASDTVVSGGWVTLFGVNNPVGSCVAIDSAYWDNQGNYFFTSFPVNYPAYILKAEFTYGSPIGNNYIPSYYDTLYSWMNSPPVFPVVDTTTYDIQLIRTVPNQLQGLGYIAGNITDKVDKESNTILEDLDVLLINQYNQVLKLKKPSSMGNYSFTNLPYANYRVFVELPGKITNPATITLNASTPYINNLNFVINDNVISLAVTEEIELQNAISAIYPNPASEKFCIDIKLKKAEDIRIEVYNQFGQLMIQKALVVETGSQHIILSINELTAGFYTVKISDKKQSLSRKLIKF